MPLVVRMTLAPASKIFWMRSLVMSISRCRIRSTSFTSFTTTCVRVVCYMNTCVYACTHVCMHVCEETTSPPATHPPTHLHPQLELVPLQPKVQKGDLGPFDDGGHALRCPRAGEGEAVDEMGFHGGLAVALEDVDGAVWVWCVVWVCGMREGGGGRRGWMDE
jgi:hypothetical protein